MNQTTYNVQISYGNRLLTSIDRFPIFTGAVSFLFGESGIGKSILAKAIYGLLDPGLFSGSVNGIKYTHYYSDPMTHEICKYGFFVFQEPSSHLNPLMTIADQLTEGSISQPGRQAAILKRLWEGSDPGAVESILPVYPKPHRPSGGEKQRVLLAMAFKKMELSLLIKPSPQPPLFVFDEPTGSLDNRFRDHFIETLLGYYNTRQCTILFITHDYSIISLLHHKYNSILPSIRLMELYRTNSEKSAVRAFSGTQYLNWLNTQQPQSHKSSASKPLLTCDPHFSIFNRHYTLTLESKQSKTLPFIIEPGTMVYLKAGSGVGKTTFAKIIMGLFKPTQFSCNISGINLSHDTPTNSWRKHIWGKEVSMVFQHADEALNLQATVAEIFKGLPLSHKPTNTYISETLQQLFDVEISPAFLNKRVGHLSGGQKQRLNLLRALLLNVRLVILDEPLNGLDFSTMTKVLGLFQKKQALGTSFLIISHNEEIFQALVDQKHIYHLAYETI